MLKEELEQLVPEAAVAAPLPVPTLTRIPEAEFVCLAERELPARALARQIVTTLPRSIRPSKRR